jgi:hypothetical protein
VCFSARAWEVRSTACTITSLHITSTNISYAAAAQAKKKNSEAVPVNLSGHMVGQRWSDICKVVRNIHNPSWEHVLRQNYNNKPPSGQKWEDVLVATREQVLRSSDAKAARLAKKKAAVDAGDADDDASDADDDAGDDAGDGAGKDEGDDTGADEDQASQEGEDVDRKPAAPPLAVTTNNNKRGKKINPFPKYWLPWLVMGPFANEGKDNECRVHPFILPAKGIEEDEESYGVSRKRLSACSSVASSCSASSTGSVSNYGIGKKSRAMLKKEAAERSLVEKTGKTSKQHKETQNVAGLAEAISSASAGQWEEFQAFMNNSAEMEKRKEERERHSAEINKRKEERERLMTLINAQKVLLDAAPEPMKGDLFAELILLNNELKDLAS